MVGKGSTLVDMSYSTSYRIFDAVCDRPSRRFFKGRKKKVRRMCRAFSADGWSRKKAGAMSPQQRTSKFIFQMEEHLWIN